MVDANSPTSDVMMDEQGVMEQAPSCDEGNERVRRGRRVRVVFEGGGAKGISHVGALKALEEADLEIVGYAGTSAGAIVAALAAAGLKADEIFDPEGDHDILKSYGTTPLGLLGTGRWWTFRFLMSFSIPAFNMMPIISILLMVMALWGSPWSEARRIVALGLLVVLVGSLAVPTLFFFILNQRLGFLSTKRVGHLIDQILAEKLGRIWHEGDDGVTFAELATASRPDLKIIASDLTNGELALFDHRTGDVGVGAVVAASAAIPIAFRPVEIKRNGESRLYVDGGLVSNLPCWVFADGDLDVGADDDRIPVLAFRLGKGGPARRWPFISWLAKRVGLPNLAGSSRVAASKKNRGRVEGHLFDVFETGMFGSQRVVERLVPGLHVIELQSPLSTYDFDGDRGMLRAAYEQSKERASAAISMIPVFAHKAGNGGLSSGLIRP